MTIEKKYQDSLFLAAVKPTPTSSKDVYEGVGVTELNWFIDNNR